MHAKLILSNLHFGHHLDKLWCTD